MGFNGPLEEIRQVCKQVKARPALQFIDRHDVVDRKRGERNVLRHIQGQRPYAISRLGHDQLPVRARHVDPGGKTILRVAGHTTDQHPDLAVFRRP